MMVGLLIAGGMSLSTLAAIAQVSPNAGTQITNKAYGSFGQAGGGTTVVESNEVIVTISEVAGITVTAGGSNHDGEVNPGDIISFDFTLTNVGNDPTQFFIPGSPSSVTNGSFNSSTHPIQIIAYDPDGSGLEATTQSVSVNVPASGIQTGNAGALALPNGALPAGGTVTVRVPVTVDMGATNGSLVSVTLGETTPDGSGSTQNQPYTDNGLDVYTQDNNLSDAVDSPLTSGVETETANAPVNGIREASASQTSVVIDGPRFDYGDAPDTTAGGYETLRVNNGPSHGIDPNIYIGSAAPDADADGFGDGTDTQGDATDDDTKDSADEGSLTFPSLETRATTYSVTVPVSNNTGNDAVLVGWLDFDRNGIFDSDEAVVSSPVPSSGIGQVTTLTWNGIGTSLDINAGATYARFRLSTDTDVAGGGTSLSATTPNGAASDGEVEDYQLVIEEAAEMLIVKRITAINHQAVNPNDGVTVLNAYVDDTTSPQQAEDNHPFWPDNDNNSAPDLYGAINAGPVKPGDEIEYTVYFLNSGTVPLAGVRLCDRLQSGLSLNRDTYGVNQDILLKIGADPEIGLTAVNDGGDRAEFIVAGAPVPSTCNIQSPNTNGVLMLDLTGTTGVPTFTSLPTASGPQGNQSYGYFKFTVKVD